MVTATDLDEFKSLLKDMQSFLRQEEKDLLYFFSSDKKDLFPTKEHLPLQQPNKKPISSIPKTPLQPPRTATENIQLKPPKNTTPPQTTIATAAPKPQAPEPQTFQPKPPEPLPAPSVEKPPATPQSQPEIEPTSSFKQDKPKPIERDFFGLQNLMTKIAPQIKVLPSSPSDREAKLLSQNWKLKKTAAPITIVFYQENPIERKFLLNIAKAIDAHFSFECRLVNVKDIEKDNLWSNFLQTTSLSLIIAQDTTIWNLSHLKKLYRSIPSQSEHFIEKTPLFLLPALSLYLKQPGLKKSLWHALCKKIHESMHE